jgi:tyrosyl-DNA phosphodiesterase-1
MSKGKLLLKTTTNECLGAWGALQKGGSQFMIRNFEVGVLFLPSSFKKDNGKKTTNLY